MGGLQLALGFEGGAAHRRRDPHGDSASTIFDLQHDRQHVRIYPATVDTYAVTVEAQAIRMLADTAISGTACAVPAVHATYGKRLLGLRPHQAQPAGPMELYVLLPDSEIHIIHPHRLATILTEIADTLR